jgi:hypothetical protein
MMLTFAFRFLKWVMGRFQKFGSEIILEIPNLKSIGEDAQLGDISLPLLEKIGGDAMLNPNTYIPKLKEVYGTLVSRTNSLARRLPADMEVNDYAGDTSQLEYYHKESGEKNRTKYRIFKNR